MITRFEYGGAYQNGFSLTIKFLVAKGVPGDAAEEVAQAAWTRGWERVSQLRKPEQLRTWVNSIALNLYRRALRHDRRMEPLLDMAGGRKMDLAAIDLATVLNACGPSDRLLLIHQLNGFTTKEMARRIGASEGAVRVRLTRARRTARSIGRAMVAA
ncbi:MAG TPA: sigma-70 family RNA polymerase sigma factor [Bryobacteraceae bacterium]